MLKDEGEQVQSRDEASQRDGLASAVAKRATLPRRRTFHFEAHTRIREFLALRDFSRQSLTLQTSNDVGILACRT